MVEEGAVEIDDLLKGRIIALKAERETAAAAMARAQAGGRQAAFLTRDRIEGFARRMRELLDQGEISFRKAYIGSIIDKIEVADGQVRICGRKMFWNRRL